MDIVKKEKKRAGDKRCVTVGSLKDNPTLKMKTIENLIYRSIFRHFEYWDKVIIDY